MPWLKWLPWRFLIRRLARAHGFLDPMSVLSRLHRFAQPSEVGEPVELLRAGVVFHARGLINSRVIQHNLDWVWPYWVERQFDPGDDAFIPRAFSITHVNLTHRNWTAVGWPDCPELPIVDPRGLLTPLFDGWSLEGWIKTDDGRWLLPSRTNAEQRLDLRDGVVVITTSREMGLELTSRASVELASGQPVCRLALTAKADSAGWLVLALRPYNPEGISFIHDVALSPERSAWNIEGQRAVEFDAPAERHHVSDYRAGDVYIHLQDLEDQQRGACEVGMSTAAALFRLEPGQPRTIGVSVPLGDAHKTAQVAETTWEESLRGHCQLSVPDAHFQCLYDAALRTLILHSPDDVYPGPYTYKRFWFRDAAFIIHGLLCAGLSGRAERALDRFPSRQTARGYFHSQEGEWDANGEALWIMRRYCELTGRAPKPAWREAIVQGAHWILRKRLPDEPVSPHAGLLPAGFSAEHLGPNDYYYWDDFWSIAGLHSAAALCGLTDEEALRAEFTHAAGEFQQAVERSLAGVAKRLGRPAMPASPYRRLDAGAIGSLAVGYPAQLCAPDDSRLLDTVEFLLEHCLVEGGFFQDMIHSGINPYLTLHLAQVLLRAGDPRYLALMDAVAALASPTGQWPEAIHPRTRGGCMGDGQHVWAAAEWVLMLRHCFVREEDESLILCQGVPARWLAGAALLTFGPAPTAFGPVSISVERNADTGRVTVAWHGAWHGAAPAIEVRLPGFRPVAAQPGAASVELVQEKI
ncbi:MAG: hypothetical protein Q8L89_03240 [Gammaproteobacteria bacterium]|nr:hypothetical protein [Gammaproteobacteria bacterium]